MGQELTGKVAVITGGASGIGRAPVWDANQPLKRHGHPADVANAALFLCSEKSAQITGIAMPIDGGISAGDPVNHLQEIFDARTQAMQN